MIPHALFGLLACGSDAQDSSPTDADGDGYVAADDCDDGDDDLHPDAVEHCDGVDEDCDGIVDNDPTDGEPFYVDADGDGFGASGTSGETACSPPEHFVGNDDDCDDADASINPDTIWFADADGDGFGAAKIAVACEAPPDSAASPGDCDDAAAAVHPGAPEVCDTVDNDCDGSVDAGAVDALEWHLDTDEDGWGDITPIYACDEPEGAVPSALDCDDSANWIHPEAAEGCDDAEDTDCSGRPSNGCDVRSVGDADLTLTANSFSQAVGYAVATAGDINGDGVTDLLTGAPDYGGDVAGTGGAAFVVNGASLSFGESPTPVDEAAQAAVLGAAGDYVGSLLSGAEDVNGDGYDDIAVGFAIDDTVCRDCGSARIFLGPLDGSYAPDDAGVRVFGQVRFGYLGGTLSKGDFDADGQADLIVGTASASTSGDTDDGVLYFFRGPVTSDVDLTKSDATFEGDPHSESAGSATTLKDIDGDGVADIALGAPALDGGQILVLHGPISGVMTSKDADAVYVAHHDDDELGTRCAWAGDLDGDGSQELAVAALNADEGGFSSGSVYIVSGAAVGSGDIADVADATITGSTNKQYLGNAIAEGADIDSDGRDDLLIGDSKDATLFKYDDDAGAAFVFYGPVDALRLASSADHIFLGTGINSGAGCDVDLIDFDDDGALDLLIGSDNADLSGALYVVSNTSL